MSTDRLSKDGRLRKTYELYPLAIMTSLFPFATCYGRACNSSFPVTLLSFAVLLEDLLCDVAIGLWLPRSVSEYEYVHCEKRFNNSVV
jgi:hypothetical protein